MVLIENRTETEPIDENPEPHSTSYFYVRLSCYVVLTLDSRL